MGETFQWMGRPGGRGGDAGDGAGLVETRIAERPAPAPGAALLGATPSSRSPLATFSQSYGSLASAA
jgi:hypothetical protein